jgi:hypothetical protein
MTDGAVVEMVFLDHFLDFPGRDSLAMRHAVKPGDFPAAIADMLASQGYNPRFLFDGDVAVALAVRRPRRTFKRAEVSDVVSLLPSVERFPGDAEITAGFGDVFRLAIMVEPGETFLGLGAQICRGIRPTVE